MAYKLQTVVDRRETGERRREGDSLAGSRVREQICGSASSLWEALLLGLTQKGFLN